MISSVVLARGVQDVLGRHGREDQADVFRGAVVDGLRGDLAEFDEVLDAVQVVLGDDFAVLVGVRAAADVAEAFEEVVDVVDARAGPRVRRGDADEVVHVGGAVLVRRGGQHHDAAAAFADGGGLEESPTAHREAETAKAHRG